MSGDVQVTIKLGGQDYRTLCRELEYHDQALRDQYKEMSGGPHKQAHQKRLVLWQSVVEKVKS